MKFILSFLLICLSLNIKSQTSFLDSLKRINIELDVRIHEIFNNADLLDQDILIVRKYDSLNCRLRDNYCRVMHKIDTCSINYILDVETNFTIDYCNVSKIRRSSEIQICENDFPEIENSFSQQYSDHQSYFSDTKPTIIDFSKSDYTLIGKINGKYIYEVFDKEFIKEFHSGILYFVLTSYLGL